MRVGICTWWFNRGQAVIGRHLRSAMDQLGHESFVLARPTQATNVRPAFVDKSDVWDQPGVTEASSYDIPADELAAWAEETAIEVCLFFQNFQFEEIARLRRSGVRTIGYFVWEAFSPAHVAPAKESFDVIYSLHAAEQSRYKLLGIDSPRVHWGCHPELLEVEGSKSDDGKVTFMFPGGFMSKRKPIQEVLEALAITPEADIRLLVKAQMDRETDPVKEAAERDPRIELIADELPTAEHLRLFASSDVCLAPSRWEGVGLHLYEATAFGLPLIVNDNAPMNEIVHHESNGLLVPGIPDGKARGMADGISAFTVRPNDLSNAIKRLMSTEVRQRLAAGALQARDRWSWQRTLSDLHDLLDATIESSR